MGSNIIPFSAEGALPARLANRGERSTSINKDVVRAPAYPTLSIKGKVFTIVKDGQKKILTKPDEPDEVAQSIGVVVLRANMGSKNFYRNGFKEGDASPPDCWSHDGIVPSPNAREPQAKKCALCPHNVWGSRISNDGDRPGEEKKGKACSDQGRLAVAAPDAMDKGAMLLRVPPASIKNWRAAVKVIDGRKLDYNEVVFKVSFDPQQASPMLMFKPIGILQDAEYEVAKGQYDTELVRSIVGLDDHFEETPEPQAPVSGDELDAALAARDATRKAAETSAPAPAASPAPTPAPTAAPRRAKAPAPTAAPAPAVDESELDGVLGTTAAPAPAPAAPAAAPTPPAASGGGDLLSDLDALLGGTDD